MGLLLSVQISRGGQALGVCQFDSDAQRTLKIGRLPNAQIKLEDPKVARIHAIIEISGADVSFVDMGSTVGSMVNGQRATKLKLQSGDSITVGDTLLVLTFGAEVLKVAEAVAAIPAAQVASVVAPTLTAPAAETVVPRAPWISASSPNRGYTSGLEPEGEISASNCYLELRCYWGDALMGMYHYRRPKKITLGEAKKTNIFIASEGLPSTSFPLIRYIDDEYILTYTSDMTGEIEMGAKTYALADLHGLRMASSDESLPHSFQVALPLDARGVLHFGGATIGLRFVPPPERVIGGPFSQFDSAFANTSIVSLFVHLAAIITLLVFPYDADALRVDLFKQPDRFASLILEAPKETKSNKEMLDKIKKSVEEDQKKMAEATPKDDNVKAKKDLLKTAKPLNKNAPSAAPRTEAEKRADVAKRFSSLLADSAGAGNILGGAGGGSLAGTLHNVIGTAGAGSATAGLAGLGIRGSAPALGGGIGTSRGVGGIGTTGRLGGGGLAYGSAVGIGEKHDRNIVNIETPEVMGALPADVIKKVINDNKAQVRYCYEFELQRNQNLEGRVAMRWIIGADGSVTEVSVKESTLKNIGVESCLMGKIKGWKFPAPAGGGVVEVNYPFVFKAS